MSDDPNSSSSNQPRQGDHIYAPGAQGIVTNPSGPVTLNFNQAERKQALVCPKPLPKPLQFGGRDKELEELKGRLKADKAVALTSLNGLGGIGKTTLARQLAHDLYYEAEAERFFRAVLWVELAQKPDEGRLLERLGQQADPQFGRKPEEEISDFAVRVRRTLEAAIEQECAECGPNRVLLVLDDVWEDGVELARLIQNYVPEKTTVLITTRAAKVAALLGTNSQQITKMQPEEGAALLREFLADAPQKDLLELSAALDGYTLALKLAAKRLLAEPDTQGELSEHIRQYRKELPAGTEFARLELEQGDKKEENLTKTLFYSYAALEAAEQAYFRALGAITHGLFDLPMLTALWQLSEEEAKAKAKRFWQLGLLELDVARFGEVKFGSGAKFGGARPGWYRLHPVLQSYALALLKRDAAEHAEAIARYQDYVIEVAGQFNKLPPEEWEQLTTYLPHIHVVGAELVKAAAESETDEAIQCRALAFAFNIRVYLFNRREVREVSWLEMGLAASRYLQDQEGEGLFLHELGNYYNTLGEKTRSLKLYDQALTLYKALQNQKDEATALTNIGKTYSDLGQKDKALHFLKQALPIRQTINDQKGEAGTLNNIGKVYDDLGQKDKALDYFEQALSLFQTSGDYRGEGVTLNNIGKIYSYVGEKNKALAFFEQALVIARILSDRGGEGLILNNIGMVYDDLGQKGKALDYFEQAFIHQTTVMDQNGKANTLNNIGAVYNDLGQKNKAFQFYNEALSIFIAVGDQSGEAAILNNIGKLYNDLGQKDLALHFFEQALPLRQIVGDQSGEAAILNNIGMLRGDLGQKDEALQYLKKALLMQRSIGNKIGEANTLNNIGKVHDDLGEKNKAFQFFEQAMSIHRISGDKGGEAITLTNISLLLWQRGERKQALKLMEQSQALFEYVRSPMTQVVAMRVATMQATIQSNSRSNLKERRGLNSKQKRKQK